MIVAAGPEIILTSVIKGFSNVAFTGSLIATAAMTAAIFAYAKRRPKGTPLTWGQAMLAGTYVTFLLFFAFGVVPHQWLTYAEGQLAMRSDAILAGPGSTGWLKDIPIVISKEVLSHIVATTIYGVMFTGSLKVWGAWQTRGEGQTEAVETSTYGRPLVKA